MNSQCFTLQQVNKESTLAHHNIATLHKQWILIKYIHLAGIFRIDGRLHFQLILYTVTIFYHISDRMEHLDKVRIFDFYIVN